MGKGVLPGEQSGCLGRTAWGERRAEHPSGRCLLRAAPSPASAASPEIPPLLSSPVPGTTRVAVSMSYPGLIDITLSKDRGFV